jgi:hypothetical protein
VGREKHRRSPTGESPDHVPGAAARRGVETGGRLVEKEQTRISDDAEAEVQAALLTTRERLHPVVCLLSQPDELDHLIDRSRVGVVPGVASEGLAHRQERLDRELLEHDPHAFAQLTTRRWVGRVESEHLDDAPVTLAKALEDLDDRGLAGAVRSEQGEDLPLVDLKGDVLDSFGPFVGLHETLDRDNRHIPSSVAPEGDYTW